ncbi:vitamin B12-dependent ribonucleotide reductase [archaeon]|nr:vitamin B12-dependent ribonucleotide reductase [archaeon]MBL7056772.1 vitamin B12-dependent ribonucleotide reductase [Candidatus Woesearchaeota archaeon]
MSLVKKIRKRDGVTVPFDQDRITKAILKAVVAVQGQDGVLSKKLSDKVVEKLEIRFGSTKVPEVEEIQDLVEETLMDNGQLSVMKAYIIYRYKHDLIREERKVVIGKPTQSKLTINALKVLKERYLLKDSQGKIVETPNDLFMRVARNIAKADRMYDRDADIKKLREEFFDMMVDLDFVPNSPTLMNAGMDLQQLAACFVLPIQDSMEGIFGTLKDAAIIHKSGGGTGFSFSRLRPRNANVKSTQGVASGPVSFLTVYNAATEVIKQGGKRRGANMGVLRIDHPDILDFINCKEKNDAITNFNISVGITEDFMKSVESDQDYDLINPATKEIVTRMSARMVFDMLVSAAWRNGDPGILFIDRINQDNATPALGEMESTNPCGEQPLLPYEACNLGSINLGNFVEEDKSIDWDRLKVIIHRAIHFLDNVIDMSRYPIPQITKVVRANRKVGLGVMGWGDMLIKLMIPYNSDEGVNKAEEVMSFIKKEADIASCNLAKKRGTFPNWTGSIFNKNSKYFKGEHLKLRNATRTTIAPTGTIGMIADASGGVEPLFALSYVKRVMDGKELFYVDKNFKKMLEKRGLYSKELMEKVINQGSISHIEELPEDIKRVFVVAHDISPEYHLKMQSAFQKYTDNAVSKTVNFSNEASIKDVENVYILAYKLGCKGVTIYRDGSKENQVMNLNVNLKREKEEKKNQGVADKPTGKKSDICPDCGGKMKFQEGCATCISCGFSYCSAS